MKKRLQHRCFSLNIAKFLRKAFLIEHLWWLLLDIHIFSKFAVLTFFIPRLESVFLSKSLFTNSYRITYVFPSVLIFFNKNGHKRKNVTPIKRPRGSS